jgi:hypothetical protein
MSGFGMMPISALMIELACEVTYPVGEAMSTGRLNMGDKSSASLGPSSGRATIFPFPCEPCDVSLHGSFGGFL